MHLSSPPPVLRVLALTILLSIPARAENPMCRAGDKDQPPACLGIGGTADALAGTTKSSSNVVGGSLAACGTSPMTGFFRTGSCETGPDDAGVHTVCATLTGEFLAFTKSVGNDLSTPMPQFGFQGLKPGQRWCLCADRWLEAEVAGKAPPVVLSATHLKTLAVVPLATLQKYPSQE